MNTFMYMIMIKLKHRNTRISAVVGCFAILLCLFVCITTRTYAQNTDSIATTAANEATVTDTSGGPSLTNISKTNAAIQEEARWNTIVSYIQMAVGFTIVITVAWFLASWARKQEKKKEAERAQRIEKALQNRPPGGAKVRRR